MKILTRLFLYVSLLIVLLSLNQCKQNDPDPVNQLPPATQTGAGTIGCLVNGQPWTPQGFDGTSNYSIDYDQRRGGVFDLRAYRYQKQPSDNYQYLILYATRLNGPKTYSFRDSTNTEASFNDRLTGCELSSRDKAAYRQGTLTVTRFDLQAGIISGTFDFTLAKAGCDTLKITNGRFDYKL
jgi:hypothetical protein